MQTTPFGLKEGFLKLIKACIERYGEIGFAGLNAGINAQFEFEAMNDRRSSTRSSKPISLATYTAQSKHGPTSNKTEDKF